MNIILSNNFVLWVLEIVSRGHFAMSLIQKIIKHIWPSLSKNAPHPRYKTAAANELLTLLVVDNLRLEIYILFHVSAYMLLY